jgi:hypothetical protein
MNWLFWGFVGFLAGTALVFFAYSFLEWQARKREMKERGTRYVVRDGVAIEVDEGPYGDFMADVIAQTMKTGKPQFGTIDTSTGEVTINQVDEEDNDASQA